MNTEKFSEAQQHYREGDYRRSARLFLDAVEKGTPIGNGPAYHMAGNSFMRLKRFSDATVVFEHALRDDTYMRRAAVEANLANAYVRSGDYDSAIAHYEAALALSDEEGNYKLYQGVALAYMKQQKYELAAIAYKHAALDTHNPAPGKALLNLGLAMMANGSAEAAIEAYQAALASPDYENKGRALLNIGIAYHSAGRWQEAVNAFEEAKLQTAYIESDRARSLLADAQHRLLLESQVAEADQLISADQEEVLSATDVYPDHSQTFADPVQEAAAAAGIPDDSQNTETFAAVGDQADAVGELYPQREVKVGNAEDVERFFALSDKEVAEQGREQMKKDRGKFFWVKWVLIITLLLGALGGGGSALYFTGFGVPSAESTVTRLLDSYAAGRSIAEYWTFGAQGSIESEMVIVPIPADFTINSIDSGSSATTVQVNIISAGNESFVFVFELVREGLGWKIEGILATDYVFEDGPYGEFGEVDEDIDSYDYEDDFFDEEFEEDENYGLDLGEQAPE